MGVENLKDAEVIRRLRSQFILLIISSMGIVSYLNARVAYASENKIISSAGLNPALALIGFNYTDRDIEDYSVKGVGGGDVRLSSSTSGGGGSTCCISFSSVRPPLGKVKVRWQSDGCMYLLKNEITGKSQKIRHLYYKEASVDVKDISLGNPRYIETHFYPDGIVQVLLTKEISNPLIRLDGNRPDKSAFPGCKDGKKPE